MSELSSIFAWIDSQSDRMIGLVRDWAAVNSYSYNLSGLEQVSGLLRSEWSRLGTVEEIPLGTEEIVDASGRVIPAPLGCALRIRKRPDAPHQVFLCIHMDTVYPQDGPFQQVTRIGANTLRGPGVCDAKGGLAVMLIAVEAMERSKWARDIGWEVLINPDEEIGSPGSSPLFEEAAKRNHVGLLFEPALPDGSMVAERGGSGNYAAVIRGRSAHAGRDFHNGRNAIVAAAQMSLKLSQLTSGGITVNVGKIDGGGPANVVPDLAICRFNVRAKAPLEQKTIQAGIEQVAGEIKRIEGISVGLHGGFHRPPKPLDQPTRQLQQQVEGCGKQLGIATSWRYSGGVSDGNQLAAAGLPNIDSLGPRGGNIHSPEEFLLLDSLTERAKLALMMLMKIARGEEPSFCATD
ncbi:MAG TPA: hydrolase [Humisphaera sp.]|jgi:glutamate carboxypeptidase|nr:hydrolase [Humisphaera sp.]